MSAPLPQNKTEFMEHLHHAWMELQQMLDALSEAQMTTLTDQVGWTIKDHLAHLIAWEQGIVALLNRQPRYPAMGLTTEMTQTQSEDELNEIMRQRFAPRSLSDVRDTLRQTHEALQAALTSLSEADLLKPYAYYQPAEPSNDDVRPVAGWILGNSSGHYLEHLPWMRAIAAQG